MNAEALRWQPIDTAPEDREILIYIPAWGAIIARFNGEFDERASRMQCPVSLTEDADRPTHWMALPEPPGAGAAEPSEHERFPAARPMPHAAAVSPRMKTGH
jgi:hypothetical protein